MARILVIDDEPIYHQMIDHALRPLGYEVYFALDGMQGLNAASALEPDVVITDVMMPGMSGYEVARQLRKNPRFTLTPILVLTSRSELGDKLSAFESGSDDYMSKPFDPEELVARMHVLLRRADLMRNVKDVEKVKIDQARLIGVHSLRGGVGCSSIAVNLAIAYWEIWQKPTLIVDSVMTAGSVALMLNAPMKRTWADLAQIAPADLDIEALKSIIGAHKHGLHFITGPARPAEAEMVPNDTLRSAINILRTKYEYMVIDIPHDFSETSIHMLDAVDTILLVLAPEMASIRGAAVALDTYDKLGYKMEKIQLVLNHVAESTGLTARKIEDALNVKIRLEIPYASQDFIRAINIGKPLLYGGTNPDVSGLLEDAAFRLSKEAHRKVPPTHPSVAWRQVQKRISQERERSEA
ncbi:MAG: response regulator [Chloroflexi bacterium]|nr:response regulator [Chloroflexota bacterium]